MTCIQFQALVTDLAAAVRYASGLARRGGLLVAILCTPLMPAGAAEDLLALYEEARQQDPVLGAAEARYQAVTEQVPQARSQLLPRVEVDAGIDRERLEFGDDVPGGGGAGGSFTSQGWGATVTQPIYDARAWPALDASRSQVEAAEQELEAARQELMVRLVNAYFDVLLADDSVRTALAQKAAIAQQLAQAERAFEVGTGTVVDVDEAKARFDLAHADLIEARNDLDVARQALRRIVGRTPDELVPLRREPELEPPGFGKMTEWENRAVEQARALQAQAARVESAQHDVESARGERYPRLDAVASYRDDRDTTFGGGTRADVETTRIGLQVVVPLYQGGGAGARLRERAAELEAAREDLTDTRLQVVEATRTAYLRVESGLSRTRALRQALRSSQSSLRSTQRGFQVGVRSSVDVLDAVQQVYAAQRDLSAAQYDLIRNRVALQDAAGVLSTPDLRELNGLLDPDGGPQLLDLPLPLDIPSGGM